MTSQELKQKRFATQDLKRKRFVTPGICIFGRAREKCAAKLLHGKQKRFVTQDLKQKRFVTQARNEFPAKLI